MKKTLGLIVLSILFCNCKSPSIDKIYNFSGSAGVVSNNRIKFYDFFDDEEFYGWYENKEIEFELPKGYKKILNKEIEGNDFLYILIGVNLKNKIQFYILGRESWQIMPELELNLPKGYKNIFLSGINYDYEYARDKIQIEIGVILNDKIQFYQYKDGWNDKAIMELNLSEGYKNVSDGFSYFFNTYDWEKYDFVGYSQDEIGFYYIGETLGLIIDNKIQFFGWNEYDLLIIPELEFNLPKGYKNLFFIATELHDTCIGVVLDNEVQFYNFKNERGWQKDNRGDNYVF